MNLFYMLERRDRNAAYDGDPQRASKKVQGEAWRGIDMPAGSSITVPNARRHHTLRSWPDTCGWFVLAPENGPDLEVSFRRSGSAEVVGRARVPAGSPGFVAVRLPWPLSAVGEVDLVLSAVAPEAEPSASPLLAVHRGLSRSLGIARADRQPPSLFLAVHRALSRADFIKSAKGVGLEIGPGPQPQILPSDDVQASYLEQMHPERWNELYNAGGKYPVRPELWSNYIVGDASNVPCDDESLDFIFSSHVFEHLSNPIGHLERWARKLKSGGRVLCVVPDLGGSKDYFQQPSELAELEREFTQETWEPTVAHYARHMRRKPDDPRLLKAMSDRESIHVHYYTNTNIERLLTRVCKTLDFSSFSLIWTPNHKDFYFSLKKA
jgi:Methyltransferase domain